MRCRLSSEGFTLLEIMVTVAIMAIVLVAIFDLHSQTIQMNIDARFYATAPFLAQEKLAELEVAQFEDATSDSGDFGEEYPGYKWQTSVEEITSEALNVSGMGFRKIRVHISYNADDLTYDFDTYRYYYENE